MSDTNRAVTGRKTDAEIRATIAELDTVIMSPRASKTLKLMAYSSIETMRWTLGEAEHPQQAVLSPEREWWSTDGVHVLRAPSGEWTVRKDGSRWAVDSPTERQVDLLAKLGDAKRSAERLADRAGK